MPTEIERKFLIRDDAWQALADAGVACRQGYISTEPACAVRVRIIGDRATLSIKALASDGRDLATRLEYEYPIPTSEAEEMLANLCAGAIIEKTRRRLSHAGMMWEIDVFHGDNAGLVVAEVELESRDQHIDLPTWVGDEVTDDSRYLNVNLAVRPYTTW
ncbi:MAG: CYTH domain-containing protein [Phycisphaerales bacterium]|nr:CYTH domain-containing protein [Phycisphaerales bacterium]